MLPPLFILHGVWLPPSDEGGGTSLRVTEGEICRERRLVVPYKSTIDKMN